ncbi:hypothetical protein [Sulfurimonas sp.]|uniref:hypothetical protein n=1 Tax=Sulfurimonas sp. TaxID=2022749 RepID=UPI003D0E087F
MFSTGIRKLTPEIHERLKKLNKGLRAEMLGEHHCWLYHCIYDHTILSWEEIASISHIAVDIKPMYQYDFELIK